ncbi:MAG TPA: glucose-6-phosphate dehydrogenase [Rhizomicrobium sp.]|nr:glucose-6-phosphate dehydrogenase [Rhizomicrobium sp.]
MTTQRAIVIFGATGDLARRMLFPSLYFLEQDGLLPPSFAIIGCSRKPLSREDFAASIESAVRERVGDAFTPAVWDKLSARLSHAAVDATKDESFRHLASALGQTRDVIFYLSTSPAHFGPICKSLKAHGLAHDTSRVMVEKPLGHDLASCRAINDALAQTFAENNTFRVDHYLGKEAVQNLLALRFANTLFEPLWNKVSIEQVQITVAETVGVEDRWSYYDEYGAIRDMVQNHMLQLLCLVAMEAPPHLDADSVRDEKVKVLRSLRPISGRDLERNTVRGQYTAGVSGSSAVPGYSEESGGHKSKTETFVAIRANIDNWRWAGVPFYLRTGKRLPLRRSEIVIQFRDVPHSVFSGNNLQANRLTIRLQPEERISLKIMNKTPNLERMELQPLSLNLSLSDAFSSGRRRIAYERLLLEALQDTPTLFVRRDEAEAAWTWVDGIVQGWQHSGGEPVPYAAGSWGPSSAFALTERNGHSWYD